MKKESFYTALSLCYDLYGVELDEDLFETWGIVAYNKIGNHDYYLHRMIVHPIADKNGGWYIDKPCDIDEIELITLPYEDALDTSSILDYPIIYTLPVEQWIEGHKVDNNALYNSGKMVHYRELGDKIYFNEPFPQLLLLYKSYVADADNLPYLNEKELFAVATYCAYCWFYRKGLQTKDLGTILLAALLKKDWNKACSEARNPIYLSQNDGQEILDAMTSYDRHLYNKTSKIIR